MKSKLLRKHMLSIAIFGLALIIAFGAEKVLGGLFGASTENDTVEGMWRSHSQVKGTRDPSEIFVTDLTALLTRDVRMTLPARCLLWRNTQTQMDVFLLPNATRLNVRGNRVRIDAGTVGVSA